MIKNRIKRLIKRALETLQKQPISASINIIQSDSILKGKVAVITGGTSGIGKAIAKQFADAGAFVVITGRNQEKCQIAIDDLKKESINKVIGIVHDNMDIKGIPDFIDNVLKQVPDNKIDILVNNAGLVGGDIRNTSEDEFDRIIATNLKSVFFLSKYVASHMIQSHIKGHILNIASSSSVRPAISAYTLSKWGIRGMTLGLAKMFAPHHITVNGIAPGPTATPMLGKNDYSDIALPSNPIGRYALPEEIAAMSLFLCSSQGDTIVGDIVYMTGGSGLIDFNDMDYTINPDIH